MNIGILLPRSNAHPSIGLDLLDSLRICLKNYPSTDQVNISIESIEFGNHEKDVYEKAENLLILKDVDLLIAFIDLRVLAILEPLMFATGKLLIVVNPGANYPTNWVPKPNIIFLTLNHTFLCRLTGKLASTRDQTSAIVATTFFDCGYLHGAAMIQNYTQYGGNIIFNYINNQKTYDQGFGLDTLSDFLNNNKEAKSILCVFDSYPASLFYAKLNEDKNADRVSLYVSPMMLTEEALKDIGSYRFSIRGYVPWFPEASNQRNSDFKTVVREKSKRAVSIFSLLGWEAGLILNEIRKTFTLYTDGLKMVEYLASITIDSPRGVLTLDSETNYFISNPVLCSILPGESKIKTEEIKHYEDDWGNFIAKPVEGVVSGWTNTYLCY